MKYILFIRKGTQRKMNKNCLPNNRLNRYHYKINHSGVTNLGNSSQNEDRHSSNRKQSRSKIKKESTQTSLANTTDHFIEENRFPLQEYKGNTVKPYGNLNHHSTQQTKTLKNKNEELQIQITEQGKQIEQLRYALSSIKDTVQRNARRQRETEELKAINKCLQEKYQNQVYQMSILQNQIQSLKGMLQNSQITVSVNSSQIQQSNVSRRAFYAQNYEQNVQKIKFCQECQKHKELVKELRYQLEQKAHMLEEQRLVLREKQIALSMLQQDNFMKNQSIDYLRGQIQNFEKNSKHLLNKMYTFEGTLSKDYKRPRYNCQAPQVSFPKQALGNFRY